MDDNVDKNTVKELDEIVTKFSELGEKYQDCLLKKLLEKCKSSQLQMLYSDTRQLLAKDFVPFVPHEIVDRIFSYLTPRELSRAACCNTQWRERANSDSLWKSLCRRKQWLHFGEGSSQPQELFNPTPTTHIPNSALTSPTFHPVEITCKHFAPICKWKDIYIRASHLHNNWATGRYVVLPPMRGHKDRISCLDCSGNILVSGSDDRTVVVWDVTTATAVHMFQHHADAVTCVKMRNNLLLTSSLDGMIRVYNISTGKCLGQLYQDNVDPSAVRHLYFDGVKAVSGHDDRIIRVWNVISGRCLFTLQGHTDELVSMVCNGQYAVTTSWDETIKVWDIQAGKSENVSCYFVSRTCSNLIFASMGNWIGVWWQLCYLEIIKWPNTFHNVSLIDWIFYE